MPLSADERRERLLKRQQKRELRLKELRAIEETQDSVDQNAENTDLVNRNPNVNNNSLTQDPFPEMDGNLFHALMKIMSTGRIDLDTILSSGILDRLDPMRLFGKKKERSMSLLWGFFAFIMAIIPAFFMCVLLQYPACSCLQTFTVFEKVPQLHHSIYWLLIRLPVLFFEKDKPMLKKISTLIFEYHFNRVGTIVFMLLFRNRIGCLV
ncbi:hypothetical protein PCE1_002832 [Barthelona sp. PCE]